MGGAEVSEVWLSETPDVDATSAILLGQLTLEVIEEQCIRFPKGVLWIAPQVNEKHQYSETSNLTVAHDVDSEESIRERIRMILSAEYDFQPAIKVSKGVKTTSEKIYSSILELVISEIDSAFSSRKTRNEVGYQRQLQVFENLSGYLDARVPEEWRNLAAGSLAVVVGAGPSLDETLPLLKDGFPNPVIIAADSTLRALRCEGLEPDFVINIDAEKKFESCSDDGYSPGMAILSSQSHGSWHRQWGRRSRFISGRVLTEDWLAEKGIAKTKLRAVSNAGLTALLFADFLNPAAVILVGMDLSGGGKGEERYALSTGRSHMQINAALFHKVPANFDSLVPTPFLSDWQETSQLTNELGQRRTLVNLNDRGARLEGTILIHPDKVQELRDAIGESLLPFKQTADQLQNQRRSLQGNGLNQLMTLLATRCDQAWKGFPVWSEKKHSSLNFLKTLFSDCDLASLLGDFAFTILPKIAPDSSISEQEVEQALIQLQTLIWRLEDAILECEPDEEFIRRFLTEKFG